MATHKLYMNVYMVDNEPSCLGWADAFEWAYQNDIFTNAEYMQCNDDYQLLCETLEPTFISQSDNVEMQYIPALDRSLPMLVTTITLKPEYPDMMSIIPLCPPVWQPENSFCWSRRLWDAKFFGIGYYGLVQL